MLEITETGEVRIATLEFAEEVRKFIRAWRAGGKPEEEGQKMVVARIALALIERDGESGPAITQAEGESSSNSWMNSFQKSMLLLASVLTR
jgi:hypothetical protein